VPKTPFEVSSGPPNNIFALCDPWSLGICGKIKSPLSEFACFCNYNMHKSRGKKKTFISLLISHLSILFDSILCFGGVGRAMEDLLWI